MFKIYTPKQAVRAIYARVQGIWDDPQLWKLGTLGELREDILRIIDLTLTEP